MAKNFAFASDPVLAAKVAGGVSGYWKAGYMSPIELFSFEEISSIRVYFDALLEEYLSAGANSYSITGAHLRHYGVWDIVTSNRLASMLKPLLGPSIVAWGAHFFCKMPGDNLMIEWHQDAPYWPLSPPESVTVWIAIDRVDRGNACMKVIPGSHISGPLPHQDAPSESVLPKMAIDPDQYGAPHYIELEPGQASIHDNMLLHGSDKNESSRRRCGLALRFAPGHVSADDAAWRKRGIVVAGPPLNNWENAPRPKQK